MKSISGYSLRDTLQESAEVTLYRAVTDSDGTPVLLKVLRRVDAGPRALAQLRHEHTLLRALDLPGQRAIGLDRHEGCWALVMEDPGGRLLRELLRGGPVDIEPALHIGVALARLAALMHRQGVMHKDIRPANLLWNAPLRRVSPIDFSIATALDQEPARAANPDALQGDVAYISPEQTGRMNRPLDARTDLYSIGVTLYELLTGSVPFHDPGELEVLHGHIARIPPSPREVRRAIPLALSQIVMKLLAKSAEERYQSGRGLAADLEKCLRALRETGEIEPFPLSYHDHGDQLRLPQRLYGRASEVEALLSALERARAGAAELLLVAGYSGVGKSSLVNEIHRPIAALGGHFIAGKFDQLNRSVPFAPIARAFGVLLRRVLSSDAVTLSRYQRQLEEALGASAALLIDLCPELGLLLGPQPGVAPLGPIEAQHRFTSAFQRFLRVFAAAAHPLVLFLDDLHWADAASLRVLQAILTDPRSGHLLIIGAFRDNEVDAAHPLTLALGELRAKGAAVRTMTLEPLGLSDVTALIGDALRKEPAEVGPLAALVFRKTHGNPLFVSQLLTVLHKEKVLTLDEATGSFGWDLARAEQQMAAENVVDLMNRKLRYLSPATQRILGLAACIGHQFDIKTLAIISEQPRDQVAVQLWEALHAGVLIPLDADYRLMPMDVESARATPMQEAAVPVRARFLHDRVQEAAYGLIARDQEQSVHLRIGRLLWARDAAESAPDAVFDVVNHMNLGAPLITDAAERLSLARLNLVAGRRAKASTAYPVALDYLRAGLALLAPEPFERDFELSFALSIERAEGEYLSGRLEIADALSAELLARARSKRQRAEVRSLRTIVQSALGNYAAAVQSALGGLALYGIEIPDGEQAQREAMAAELAALPVSLDGRSIASLADAPVSDDPDQEMVAKLLANVGGAAHLSNPALLSLLVAKLVNLSIRRGTISASAYAYVRLGVILAGVFGRYEEAYQFGRLAITLNERFPAAHLSCKVYFSFGLYLHYKEPLRAALAYQLRTRQAGLENGDLQATSFACFHAIVCRLGMGDELGAVREEVQRSLALMERTNDTITRRNLRIAERMIANLQGRTTDLRSLCGDGFEEDGLVARVEQEGLVYTAWWYYTVKLQLLVFHEDHEGALDLLPELSRRGASAIGQYMASMLPLHASLAMAARFASASEAEQRRYSAQIAEHQAELARLSEGCPENYRHKLLLVQAEAARLDGRPLEAMALYDEAIAAAERSGFLSEQALASEVCARFYAGLGRATIARGYLGEAYALYERWGATAKLAALRERYPRLLPAAAAQVEPALEVGEREGAPPSRLTDAALDMAAALRAAQAIASEIELEPAIEQILRIAAVTAGAQRGFLILQRDGELMINAAIELAPDAIEVGLQIPLEGSADLAASLVHYAARSRELVVIGDASRDATFGADPYVVARSPRSLLCLPLVYQGRLTGALYLENNAAYDAFNPARVELLRMLSGQAASALQNAMLYARVQAVTEQLRQSLGQLREANQRLQGEFEQRARAEEARAALQEEVIRVQEARLAELSSPLIPITAEIMVMPLIGAMDAARARQVLETALQGVQRSRARVVIIDVTGIKQVDAHVAGSLISTGSALRLLGAEAVLTGIRAEVAQTLVSLGVSLGTLKTLGTLQSGIAYALRRAGQSSWSSGHA